MATAPPLPRHFLPVHTSPTPVPTGRWGGAQACPAAGGAPPPTPGASLSP